MVTLLGFFCILTNVLCLSIYCPDLVGPAPAWLYYSFAVGLWLYSTMDNIDGKQARRTGTSSGLGELFDHGIDSLNCTLASLCETASIGLGPTRAGVFTSLIPCLPMFFSTWETYHTHTLYLGYFNGPTEGLIIACMLHIFSGIYGPGIWSLPISSLPIPPALLALLPQDFSTRDLWVPGLTATFLIAHLPFCIHNVITARRRQNLPILPVFFEWTPMLIFTSAIGAWVYSPSSRIMKDNHLVLLCLTLSFVFGRMTTKIILAHLTHQPFPYWTVLLAPLVGGAMITNLEAVMGPGWGWSWEPLSVATALLGDGDVIGKAELFYLRAYFVFALVAYARWAVLVINSICAYLDINCLTIKGVSPGQETTITKKKV